MQTELKFPLHLAFAAAALIGVSSFAATAHAGACPAGQERADARTMGETMPKAVTDTEVGVVPLAKEIPGLDGRRLRLRRLVVQPGGIVPWHSHGDRPAIIATISGVLTEYRSTCAVGIDHVAGDVVAESNGVAHWWKNNGKVPAVVLSADIKNDGLPPQDDHM